MVHVKVSKDKLIRSWVDQKREKLRINTNKVIDRGKRRKIRNEVKPEKNFNKNL